MRETPGHSIFVKIECPGFDSRNMSPRRFSIGVWTDSGGVDTRENYADFWVSDWAR